MVMLLAFCTEPTIDRAIIAVLPSTVSNNDELNPITVAETKLNIYITHIDIVTC